MIRRYTEEELNKIYDILEEHCKVDNRIHEREYFIKEHLKDDYPTELRIIPSLGFGGKFKRSYNMVWIYQYPENATPKSKKIIEKVNNLLRNI